MSGIDYAVGDTVCLLRAVPAVPGSSLQVQPGDQGIVTEVGDHFLAVHLDGLRIIASKGDVVRMGPLAEA